MLYTLVTGLSLALTVTVIYVCFKVVFKWGETLRGRWKEKDWIVFWFSLGVATHFGASLIDNAYWGLAWAADYTNHPWRDALFYHGVYSNLPFRQIGTIFAGYCHLRAALLYVDRPDVLHDLHTSIFWSAFIGLYGVYLLSLV